MKTRWIVLPTALALLLTLGVVMAKRTGRSTANTTPPPQVLQNLTVNTNSATTLSQQNVNSTVTVPPAPLPDTVSISIADFYNRATKKPFGIYITPQDSPVQPEKFTGYHTGADAETTPAEANTDVPVYAALDGTVHLADHVNGYGGVITIWSTLDGTSITTLYGHLRIASFTVQAGDTVHAGEKIAVLGTGYSAETDGERKHLHFAVLPGHTAELRGYVQRQSELSLWLDPVAWLESYNAQSL